jgi:hypothetical protein
MDAFRDVLDTMDRLPRAQPSPNLADRILAATRTRFRTRQGEAPSFPGFPLPSRINWAVWVAAAAFVVFAFLRPPEFLSELGNRMNRMGHQTYSFGLRVYRGSERIIDELNVLRMTVGVAFEDRLDRLNQRLKDLEEARRKNENQTEKSSSLVPSFELTKMKARSNFADPRSLK